jgi:hypothetical protein
MTTGDQRGWRVGHRGRDQMYYEELHDGTWDRIDVDGEMLMGRAHHVIYFATPERWIEYPPWARGRRAEITARITSEFREPDYEYHGLSGTGGAAPSAAASDVSPVGAPGRTGLRQGTTPVAGNRALLVAVLVLLVLAAAMGWLVTSGVARGETYLPLKQATLRRTVSREQEPVTFWISIGVYAAIGTGALALGVLGGRAGRRP